MFSKLVSESILAFLRLFIDVEWESLKLTFWSGVTLEQLRIRHDVLAPLRLPVEVRSGCIGRLHISGDLSLARGIRPRLVVSGVVLETCSRPEAEWDPGGGAGDAGKARKSRGGAVALSIRASADFLYRELLRRALVEVSDVSIQYVDMAGDGHELTSCGFKLAQFTTESASSSDHFVSSSVHCGADATSITRYGKLAVDAVFWIPHHPYHASAAEPLHATDAAPPALSASPPPPAHNNPADRAVVRPFELHFCLKLSTAPDGASRVGVHCHLPSLQVRLSLLQLADIARMQQVCTLWARHARYAHLRPRGYTELRRRHLGFQEGFSPESPSSAVPDSEVCTEVESEPQGASADELDDTASAASELSSCSERSSATPSSATDSHASSPRSPCATWTQVWRFAIHAVQLDAAAQPLVDVRQRRRRQRLQLYEVYAASYALLHVLRARLQATARPTESGAAANSEEGANVDDCDADRPLPAPRHADAAAADAAAPRSTAASSDEVSASGQLTLFKRPDAACVVTAGSADQGSSMLGQQLSGGSAAGQHEYDGSHTLTRIHAAAAPRDSAPGWQRDQQGAWREEGASREGSSGQLAGRPAAPASPGAVPGILSEVLAELHAERRSHDGGSGCSEHAATAAVRGGDEEAAAAREWSMQLVDWVRGLPAAWTAPLGSDAARPAASDARLAALAAAWSRRDCSCAFVAPQGADPPQLRVALPSAPSNRRAADCNGPAQRGGGAEGAHKPSAPREATPLPQPPASDSEADSPSLVTVADLIAAAAAAAQQMPEQDVAAIEARVWRCQERGSLNCGTAERSPRTAAAVEPLSVCDDDLRNSCDTSPLFPLWRQLTVAAAPGKKAAAAKETRAAQTAPVSYDVAFELGKLQLEVLDEWVPSHDAADRASAPTDGSPGSLRSAESVDFTDAASSVDGGSYEFFSAPGTSFLGTYSSSSSSRPLFSAAPSVDPSLSSSRSSHPSAKRDGARAADPSLRASRQSQDALRRGSALGDAATRLANSGALSGGSEGGHQPAESAASEGGRTSSDAAPSTRRSATFPSADLYSSPVLSEPLQSAFDRALGPESTAQAPFGAADTPRALPARLSTVVGFDSPRGVAPPPADEPAHAAEHATSILTETLRTDARRQAAGGALLEPTNAADAAELLPIPACPVVVVRVEALGLRAATTSFLRPPSGDAADALLEVDDVCVIDVGMPDSQDDAKGESGAAGHVVWRSHSNSPDPANASSVADAPPSVAAATRGAPRPWAAAHSGLLVPRATSSDDLWALLASGYASAGVDAQLNPAADSAQGAIASASATAHAANVLRSRSFSGVGAGSMRRTRSFPRSLTLPEAAALFGVAVHGGGDSGPSLRHRLHGNAPWKRSTPAERPPLLTARFHAAEASASPARVAADVQPLCLRVSPRVLALLARAAGVLQALDAGAGIWADTVQSVADLPSHAARAIATADLFALYSPPPSFEATLHGVTLELEAPMGAAFGAQADGVPPADKAACVRVCMSTARVDLPATCALTLLCSALDAARLKSSGPLRHDASASLGSSAAPFCAYLQADARQLPAAAPAAPALDQLLRSGVSATCKGVLVTVEPEPGATPQSVLACESAAIDAQLPHLGWTAPSFHATLDAASVDATASALQSLARCAAASQRVVAANAAAATSRQAARRAAFEVTVAATRTTVAYTDDVSGGPRPRPVHPKVCVDAGALEFRLTSGRGGGRSLGASGMGALEGQTPPLFDSAASVFPSSLGSHSGSPLPSADDIGSSRAVASPQAVAPDTHAARLETPTALHDGGGLQSAAGSWEDAGHVRLNALRIAVLDGALAQLYPRFLGWVPLDAADATGALLSVAWTTSAPSADAPPALSSLDVELGDVVILSHAGAAGAPPRLVSSSAEGVRNGATFCMRASDGTGAVFDSALAMRGVQLSSSVAAHVAAAAATLLAGPADAADVEPDANRCARGSQPQSPGPRDSPRGSTAERRPEHEPSGSFSMRLEDCSVVGCADGLAGLFACAPAAQPHPDGDALGRASPASWIQALRQPLVLHHQPQESCSSPLQAPDRGQAAAASLSAALRSPAAGGAPAVWLHVSCWTLQIPFNLRDALLCDDAARKMQDALQAASQSIFADSEPPACGSPQPESRRSLDLLDIRDLSVALGHLEHEHRAPCMLTSHRLLSVRCIDVAATTEAADPGASSSAALVVCAARVHDVQAALAVEHVELLVAMVNAHARAYSHALSSLKALRDCEGVEIGVDRSILEMRPSHDTDPRSPQPTQMLELEFPGAMLRVKARNDAPPRAPDPSTSTGAGRSDDGDLRHASLTAALSLSPFCLSTRVLPALAARASACDAEMTGRPLTAPERSSAAQGVNALPQPQSLGPAQRWYASPPDGGPSPRGAAERGFAIRCDVLRASGGSVVAPQRDAPLTATLDLHGVWAGCGAHGDGALSTAAVVVDVAAVNCVLNARAAPVLSEVARCLSDALARARVYEDVVVSNAAALAGLPNGGADVFVTRGTGSSAAAAAHVTASASLGALTLAVVSCASASEAGDPAAAAAELLTWPGSSVCSADAGRLSASWEGLTDAGSGSQADGSAAAAASAVGEALVLRLALRATAATAADGWRLDADVDDATVAVAAARAAASPSSRAGGGGAAECLAVLSELRDVLSMPTCSFAASCTVPPVHAAHDCEPCGPLGASPPSDSSSPPTGGSPAAGWRQDHPVSAQRAPGLLSEEAARLVMSCTAPRASLELCVPDVVCAARVLAAFGPSSTPPPSTHRTTPPRSSSAAPVGAWPRPPPTHDLSKLAAGNVTATNAVSALLSGPVSALLRRLQCGVRVGQLDVLLSDRSAEAFDGVSAAVVVAAPVARLVVAEVAADASRDGDNVDATLVLHAEMRVFNAARHDWDCVINRAPLALRLGLPRADTPTDVWLTQTGRDVGDRVCEPVPDPGAPADHDSAAARPHPWLHADDGPEAHSHSAGNPPAPPARVLALSLTAPELVELSVTESAVVACAKALRLTRAVAAALRGTTALAHVAPNRHAVDGGGARVRDAAVSDGNSALVAGAEAPVQCGAAFAGEDKSEPSTGRELALRDNVAQIVVRNYTGLQLWLALAPLSTFDLCAESSAGTAAAEGWVRLPDLGAQLVDLRRFAPALDAQPCPTQGDCAGPEPARGAAAQHIFSALGANSALGHYLASCGLCVRWVIEPSEAEQATHDPSRSVPSATRASAASRGDAGFQRIGLPFIGPVPCFPSTQPWTSHHQLWPVLPPASRRDDPELSLGPNAPPSPHSPGQQAASDAPAPARAHGLGRPSGPASAEGGLHEPIDVVVEAALGPSGLLEVAVHCGWTLHNSLAHDVLVGVPAPPPAAERPASAASTLATLPEARAAVALLPPAAPQRSRSAGGARFVRALTDSACSDPGQLRALPRGDSDAEVEVALLTRVAAGASVHLPASAVRAGCVCIAPAPQALAQDRDAPALSGLLRQSRDGGAAQAPPMWSAPVPLRARSTPREMRSLDGASSLADDPLAAELHRVSCPPAARDVFCGVAAPGGADSGFSLVCRVEARPLADGLWAGGVVRLEAPLLVQNALPAAVEVTLSWQTAADSSRLSEPQRCVLNVGACSSGTLPVAVPDHARLQIALPGCTLAALRLSGAAAAPLLQCRDLQSGCLHSIHLAHRRSALALHIALHCDVWLYNLTPLALHAAAATLPGIRSSSDEALVHLHSPPAADLSAWASEPRLPALGPARTRSGEPLALGGSASSVTAAALAPPGRASESGAAPPAHGNRRQTSLDVPRTRRSTRRATLLQPSVSAASLAISEAADAGAAADAPGSACASAVPAFAAVHGVVQPRAAAGGRGDEEAARSGSGLTHLLPPPAQATRPPAAPPAASMLGSHCASDSQLVAGVAPPAPRPPSLSALLAPADSLACRPCMLSCPSPVAGEAAVGGHDSERHAWPWPHRHHDSSAIHVLHLAAAFDAAAYSLRPTPPGPHSPRVLHLKQLHESALGLHAEGASSETFPLGLGAQAPGTPQLGARVARARLDGDDILPAGDCAARAPAVSTHVVVVAPQHVVHNRLDAVLKIEQDGLAAQRMPPHGACCLQSHVGARGGRDGAALVRLCLLGTGSLSSCPVTLSAAHPVISVKLPKTAAPAVIVRVRTFAVPLPLSLRNAAVARAAPAASALVTVIDAPPPHTSPVLIENVTCHEIHVRQGGALNGERHPLALTEALPPYGRLDYVWDDHGSAGELVLRLSCGLALRLDLEDLLDVRQRVTGLLKGGRARVTADDAAMVRDARRAADNISVSVARADGRTVVRVVDTLVHPDEDVGAPSPTWHAAPEVRFVAHVEGVRLSVVHMNSSRELMTASATSLTLRCACDDGDDVHARLVIGTVQVDNCDPNTMFPVVLASPVKEPGTSLAAILPAPKLHAPAIDAAAHLERVGSVARLRQASLILARIAVQADEANLLQMQPFVDSCTRALSACGFASPSSDLEVAWVRTSAAHSVGSQPLSDIESGSSASTDARHTLVSWRSSRRPSGGTAAVLDAADKSCTVSAGAMVAVPEAESERPLQPSVTFERVHVSQLQLTFSFAAAQKAPRLPNRLQGPRHPTAGDAPRRRTGASPTSDAFWAWVAGGARRLANLSGVQLAIDAFECGGGERLTARQLQELMKEHYLGPALWKELPKLLGALDIFGDPLQLVSNLFTGLSGLYRMPVAAAHAIVAPQGWRPHRAHLSRAAVVSYAIVNSAALLVVNTVFSVAQATEKFTGAVNRLILDTLPWPYYAPGVEDSVLSVALAVATGLPACLSHSMQAWGADFPRVLLLGIPSGVALALYGTLALPAAVLCGVLRRYAYRVMCAIHRPSPLHRARLPRALDPQSGLAPAPTLPSLALALLRQLPPQRGAPPEAVLVAVLLAGAQGDGAVPLATAAWQAAAQPSDDGAGVKIAALTSARLCVLWASSAHGRAFDPAVLENAAGFELRGVQLSVALRDLMCVSRSGASVQVVAWGPRRHVDTAFAPSAPAETGTPRDAAAADLSAPQRVVAAARTLMHDAASWSEQHASAGALHAALPDGRAVRRSGLPLHLGLPVRSLVLACADEGQAQHLAHALAARMELIRQLRLYRVSRWL